MEPDLYSKQKQTAAEFWKSYFAKFRRHVEAHEVSETAPAPLASESSQPAYFPERRRSGLRRNANLRTG